MEISLVNRNTEFALYSGVIWAYGPTIGPRFRRISFVAKNQEVAEAIALAYCKAAYPSQLYFHHEFDIGISITYKTILDDGTEKKFRVILVEENKDEQ